MNLPGTKGNPSVSYALQWPDSLGSFPEEEFYWTSGHLYRKRGSFKEVNVLRPVDEVQEYANNWTTAKLEELPKWTDPADFVPYFGMEDYVSTIRRAGEEGSFFRMNSSLSYQKTLAVALCTLPPGCSILIRNEMKPPE